MSKTATQEIAIEQHFVEFYSPDTFVSEETRQPIDSWDIDKAKERAHSIKERHGATPFSFRFITRGREKDQLDSHETARSPLYHLGGVVLTVDDIKARENPKDEILISNMECNNWDRVLQNDNSWRHVTPLAADDIILDWKPRESG